MSRVAAARATGATAAAVHRRASLPKLKRTGTQGRELGIASSLSVKELQAALGVSDTGQDEPEHGHSGGSEEGNSSQNNSHRQLPLKSSGFSSSLVILKEGGLSKLTADGEWISKRAVMSKTHLDFVALDSKHQIRILDTIPLDEIQGVSLATDSIVRGSTVEKSQKPSANIMSRIKEISVTRLQRLASTGERGVLSKLGDTEVGCTFEIYTVKDGFNSGRAYTLRCESEDETHSWIDTIQDASLAAKKRARVYRTVHYWQSKAEEWYHWMPVQLFFVLLITGNFVSLAVQAQFNPEPGSHLDNLFHDVEVIFLILFCLELGWNFFAHFWWKFWQDGWNIFDVFVIIGSVIQVTSADLPIAKQLRVFRTLRLLRVFEKMAGLRRIIYCLTASILPVLQALIIGLIVCVIYATIGVEYFGKKHPKGFGTFSEAVFTVFAVVAFQDWPMDELPPFDEYSRPNYGTIVYMYSFVAIVVWVLLQIMVAVLLENFFSATARDREATAKERASHQRVLGPLDPLLEELGKQFNTNRELTSKINRLFEVLDTDMTGSLSFDELNEGLRKLNLKENIMLSKEDFHNVTEGFSLCTRDSEVLPEEFEALMRKQFRIYVQRKISDAINLNNCSSEVESILTALKVVLIEMEHTNQPFKRQSLVPPTENKQMKQDMKILNKKVDRMQSDISRLMTCLGVPSVPLEQQENGDKMELIKKVSWRSNGEEPRAFSNSAEQDSVATELGFQRSNDNQSLGEQSQTGLSDSGFFEPSHDHRVETGKLKHCNIDSPPGGIEEKLTDFSFNIEKVPNGCYPDAVRAPSPDSHDTQVVVPQSAKLPPPARQKDYGEKISESFLQTHVQSSQGKSPKQPTQAGLLQHDGGSFVRIGIQTEPTAASGDHVCVSGEVGIFFPQGLA
mmetsp:Transcript_2326/g.3731  ORF Transcript_2326/g.3731 Transcript_2326/m.3731 type:complete len:904 (+) Transcript_2326:305-3016(+)|eukprot:CAMPEP_0184312244 /NCGR_PEP_ID=MMETSP1049-20130417/48319_1 /TAXON_ID=77928 /ORGANISM="Proteomonas sulcata, Strain CCMP704" /LENGTH=903 /DNA_ID=CAMNT_0026628235 /DNA_START=280 /DNA_END=2991 /DNA_ORIENTATION=+